MGKLTYNKDNFLSLELQYQKEGEWVKCFNIPNVTLPTVTYLGFSAHTGEVTGTDLKCPRSRPSVWADLFLSA